MNSAHFPPGRGFERNLLVAKSDGDEVFLALIGRRESRASGRRACCEVPCVEKASEARPAGGTDFSEWSWVLRRPARGSGGVCLLPAARMFLGFPKGRRNQFVSRSSPGLRSGLGARN